MIKVAINGFGRIGRCFFKVALENKDLEIVAVNDLTDPENLAYLLRYDTVYGRWDKPVGVKGSNLIVDGQKIKVLSEKDPALLPWKELEVDLVVESTGRFTDHENSSKHLSAGAKKVVISANSKDADFSVVLGVNEEKYDPSKHNIVANCSCTTNCAAPVMKVLHENFNVLKAQMVTIHAVTATQNLVDGPKEDLREGRAALGNTVPAGTGAAKAVVRVLPELEGRFSGSAFRVPVLCGSVIDVVAQVEKKTGVEEINNVFEKEAKGKLKGILSVSEDALVSSDIVGTPFSAIVDLPLTEVLDGNLIKVDAWYDNEWGYSKRLADAVLLVGKSIAPS